MAVVAAADFVAALQALPLLPPEQKARLPVLVQQFPAPEALAKELVQRGWLTTFQAEQVLAGKGQELVFDQYVLFDLLGEGLGMGQVFKARQLRLKCFAALKVVRPECAALRLRPAPLPDREAEAVVRLDHPNLVRVYDASEAHGVPYLAMEYLEGTHLARLVRACGPLPCGPRL